jgi:hypothetical protein
LRTNVGGSVLVRHGDGQVLVNLAPGGNKTLVPQDFVAHASH